jgi:3-oxoacyl-[acyl-carrier-protein] synthase II
LALVGIVLQLSSLNLATSAMALFIKGMANISPQQTWDGNSLPDQTVSALGDRFTAIEPEYSNFIDPKNIRRMSRIIKMGVGAAAIALRQAKVTIPDAIITGTGYGCLEDTGIFLTKMIELKEEALNPTPFIQSTHNTIGSQIALLLQCQGYNQTYAHGAFSFESALLDASIQSEEDRSKNILLGGIDEITNVSHSIQKRFGMFRSVSNGEGSAFFLLAGNNDNAIACIDSVETLYKPDSVELENHFRALENNYDLILLGIGNKEPDKILQTLSEKVFPSASLAYFKHLSGEYPVASAFGLWLAASILNTQVTPKSVVLNTKHQSVKRVLIVNRYFGTHYSTISMSVC